MCDLRHPDLPAVFHPAELLQLLEALEFALRQCRILEQRITLKHIKSEMLQMARMSFVRGIAYPWNRRSRKVKGILIEIQHGLYDVGIHDVGRSSNRHRDGRNR